MGSIKIWSNRKITIVSLSLFMFVCAIVITGYIYMNECVKDESEAQNSRYEFTKLSTDLAETSDLLTREARQYAVTGEVSHLYNYWYEVRVDKTRDNVIEQLEKANSKQKEKLLLRQAKNYSDELIETEMCSMKLVLESQHKTVEDFCTNEKVREYVSYVLEYELPEEYAALSDDDKQKKAVEILYDSQYEKMKEKIMWPINHFQNRLNHRLDIEVENAVKGRRHALALLIASLVAAVIVAAFILIIFYKNYVLPLNDYTNQLKNRSSQTGQYDGEEPQAWLKFRIKPKGALELREFGRIYNELSHILSVEVGKNNIAWEKMRQAKEDAVRANSAKSEFMARMSHELRTPLNAIIGYIYLLEETNLASSQKRYCDSIHVASENLLELINGVLDFSKIESRKVEFEMIPFSPVELIQKVYIVMANQAQQKNIALKLDIREDLPPVVIGDSARIYQVLINLVGNAVKFTDEGSVTISLKAQMDNENDCMLCFSVKDTGIGISEEKKKEIFEPFVQSDVSINRKYGGTGLGLSISKQLIEQYSNGDETLHLESEKGAGSRFYFKIPVKIGEENLPDEMNNDKDNEQNNGKLLYDVLLVDDNEINLAVEKEILERFGLTVHTANSGKAAIDAVNKKKTDLIFLDLRMPVMNGYEVSEYLRKNHICDDIPIIALTADAAEGVERKVMICGMQECVMKPFKPQKIRTVIEKYAKIKLTDNTNKFNIINMNFEYFNISECLENMNNNNRLLYDLAKSFITKQSKYIEYMKIHILEGNFKNAKNIIHDLKGMMGNLCLMPLYEETVILEKKLDENESVSLEHFDCLWEKTRAEMEKYITGQEKEMALPDDNADFDKIKLKVISLSEKYDVQAVDLFEKYENVFGNNMDKKTFINVREAALQYDFDGLVEYLKGGDGNV